MGEPFVGEIRMFGGSFAPAGWAMCDGQLIPISQNDVLFNLIGTTYGGDGEETFALPDLQGRIPLHMGQGPGISQSYQIGEQGGVESVTITSNTTPIHSHAFLASGDSADNPNVGGNVIGTPPQLQWLYASNATTPFNSQSISQVGGNQPHENMMPFLVITFIISLFGIFPTQN
ncbi:MAG: tail fiber protein [Thermoanaerobaculia bacterium]